MSSEVVGERWALAGDYSMCLLTSMQKAKPEGVMMGSGVLEGPCSPR